MKIAVVRNEDTDGVLFRSPKMCPEKYGRRTVQAVVDALSDGGHSVGLFEGDMTLLGRLAEFFGAHGSAGATDALVLNMAYGIQGNDRYTHVPAMLESAGVPYTGSAPLGHAVCLDKVVAKVLMAQAGLPTPSYRVMSSAEDALGDLRFPLIVKPRNESTSYGLRLVATREELDEAVAAIVAIYHQEALVEEYIDGREVCVALLGNDPPEVLPAVELDFGERALKLMTWDDKFHKRADEPTKICPAELPTTLSTELADIATEAFRACHVRDYARVDFRIDPTGRPYVLEINSMASLGAGGSFVCAATAAGMDFTALVNRIADVATLRYTSPLGVGLPAPAGG